MAEDKANHDEALGKATAAICIQTSLMGMLHKKALLSREEVFAVMTAAHHTLGAMQGVSDDVRLSSAWTLKEVDAAVGRMVKRQ